MLNDAVVDVVANVVADIVAVTVDDDDVCSSGRDGGEPRGERGGGEPPSLFPLAALPPDEHLPHLWSRRLQRQLRYHRRPLRGRGIPVSVTCLRGLGFLLSYAESFPCHQSLGRLFFS